MNELNALERELVKVTDWNLCVSPAGLLGDERLKFVFSRSMRSCYSNTIHPSSAHTGTMHNPLSRRIHHSLHSRFRSHRRDCLTSWRAS